MERHGGRWWRYVPGSVREGGDAARAGPWTCRRRDGWWWWWGRWGWDEAGQGKTRGMQGCRGAERPARPASASASAADVRQWSRSAGLAWRVGRGGGGWSACGDGCGRALPRAAAGRVLGGTTLARPRAARPRSSMRPPAARRRLSRHVAAVEPAWGACLSRRRRRRRCWASRPTPLPSIGRCSAASPRHVRPARAPPPLPRPPWTRSSTCHRLCAMLAPPAPAVPHLVRGHSRIGPSAALFVLLHTRARHIKTRTFHQI